MRVPVVIAMLALGGGCNALLGVHGFGGGDGDGGPGGDGSGGDSPGDAVGVTCDPTKPFEPPAIIKELDDVTSSVFVTDVDPTGTILYLVSDHGGTDLRLWKATRPDPASPWNAPTPLSSELTVSAAVAEDGLSAVVERGADLFLTQRATTADPFGAGSGIAFNTGGIEETPRLTRDGQLLYFASTRDGGRPDLYTAKREVTTFTSVSRLDGNLLNTGDVESAPALTGDELTLYFTRGDQNNAGRDIFEVSRGSKSEFFNNPVRAGELSSSTTDEIMGAVSPDGCTIYFTRIEVGSIRAQPYVAVKPPR